jgi:hypothetical protein
VSSAELLVAQKGGANAARAYHDWKALKPHLTAISEVTKLISNGATTGYTILGYLASRGATPTATRYTQQSELLRAFQDAKVDQLVKTVMEGRLLLIDEESTIGSSTLSTPATTKLVLDMLNVTRRWQHLHQTKLHIEWREQDLVCQPGFIIIPPAQLEALDDSLYLLVKKFLPVLFYNSLEQKHSAVKHRRISVFGLIATVFR